MTIKLYYQKGCNVSNLKPVGLFKKLLVRCYRVEDVNEELEIVLNTVGDYKADIAKCKSIIDSLRDKLLSVAKDCDNLTAELKDSKSTIAGLESKLKLSKATVSKSKITITDLKQLVKLRESELEKCVNKKPVKEPEPVVAKVKLSKGRVPCNRIRKIRKLNKGGLSIDKLVEEFKLSKSIMTKIINKTIYKGC